MAEVRMKGLELLEEPDGWLLPLAGRSITQCCVDHALTLRLTEPSSDFAIRIERPFILAYPDGEEVTVAVGSAAIEAAPALVLFGRTLTRGVAYKDGQLELAFTDGTLIHVQADLAYEPWEVAGPEGLRVVSLPGGDLAIWQAEHHE